MVDKTPWQRRNIEMLNRQFAHLQTLTPDILARVEEFNLIDPTDLEARYHLENTGERRGVLYCSAVDGSGSHRLERPIRVNGQYQVMTMRVRPLTDGDIITFDRLVKRLREIDSLNVKTSTGGHVTENAGIHDSLAWRHLDLSHEAPVTLQLSYSLRSNLGQH